MVRVIQGKSAVPGTGVGKTKVFSVDLNSKIEKYQANSVDQEKDDFLEALEKAKGQVERIKEKLLERAEKDQAAIFEAHLMILVDPEFRQRCMNKIEEYKSAPHAVLNAAKEFAAIFFAFEDEYLRARGTDILDIGGRITRNLLGIGDFQWGDEPVILFAKDMEPSVLTEIPLDIVQGLALEHGSITSHAIIIAKAKGLPTIVGVSGIEGVQDGIPVVLDGSEGKIILSPSAGTFKKYSLRVEEEKRLLAEQLASASKAAVSLDGIRVQLAANIGSPQDMDRALQFGCEGVGLFRTEFLFMSQSCLPLEEDQFRAYKQVADKCGENPCVIRTLDIGGDKPLPYLDIGQEENPFLGWRAIRICLSRTDLFITQIKAILRAGVYGKVAIMLPMVISVDEIRKAKKLIKGAIAELEAEGRQFAKDVPVGIMIETPAAAVMAKQLAKECDFFSIGTNDLTQYTLAVDRGNQKVCGLYNPFHPAVLRLIAGVIEAARDKGIWVGMCGEMAGDPAAAALLFAMGIDELSMSPGCIPLVKEHIRKINSAQARNLLEYILSLDDGDKIRKYAKKALQEMIAAS